jgi:hypothetical protein
MERRVACTSSSRHQVSSLTIKLSDFRQHLEFATLTDFCQEEFSAELFVS